MATKTLLTFEQFEHLPEKEDEWYELDEGELIVMSPGRPRHNFCRDAIADSLRTFLKTHHLGRVVVETDFRLSPDTVRISDAAYITAERMNNLDLDEMIEGAPALAIEVVSPNDRAQELVRKVDQYLAAGTRCVWVVYPQTREVHIFQPDGTSRILRESESLRNDELLPGFSVEVGTLFE
jgi:Uma2 family endonuclease